MQEQPTEQSLETGGLAVVGGIASAGALAGAVAGATHHIQFLLLQGVLKLAQQGGLGIGSHGGDDGPVQVSGAGRVAAMLQAQVQFPHRVPKPGELQRSEGVVRWVGRQAPQPVAGLVAAGLLRRRTGQARCPDRFAGAESLPDAPA